MTDFNPSADFSSKNLVLGDLLKVNSWYLVVKTHFATVTCLKIATAEMTTSAHFPLDSGSYLVYRDGTLIFGDINQSFWQG